MNIENKTRNLVLAAVFMAIIIIMHLRLSGISRWDS